MSRGNFTQYTNPLTGQKANLLDLRGLLSLVLGMGVLIAVYEAGRWLFGLAKGQAAKVTTTQGSPFHVAGVNP